jgi:hypothetical protein
MTVEKNLSLLANLLAILFVLALIVHYYTTI